MVTISKPQQLLLYSTSACHLCEQASALVQPLLGQDWHLEVVDIAASDELFQRYGLTIPVLRRTDTGQEINWPFDSQDVLTLLAA